MKETPREPSVAEISALAYQLYVEDGEPAGQAEVHWRRAEEILRHPELRPADNVLAPPSEPELTRTLEAKAEEPDAGLPSDPRSGPEAYHQHLDFAADSRSTKEIRQALKELAGIEAVEDGPE